MAYFHNKEDRNTKYIYNHNDAVEMSGQTLRKECLKSITLTGHIKEKEG